MGEEQVQNGGLLADFGYTGDNINPNVDTRDLKEVYEMPELNIAPIKYPSEDPEIKKERAKSQIPSIVDRIRQSSKVSFADQQRFGSIGDALRRKSEPEGLVLHKDTPISQAYDRLNDGSYIPKYENFLADSDNEERLAKRQGAWSKWGRGLTKLVAKTGLYGVGGIINPVYGAIDAIRTGNFNAIYNNDFMKWMNDVDERLNHYLPNYYTQEEKNRSFGGKMFTANFWANDVLGGMAFTTGALASEAFWSYITGGASMAGRAARFGTRLLGKNSFASVKSMTNAYLRKASTLSNAASAVNNGRFIMTSAGWEASVEASHYMKEAELNYAQSYKNAYGRNPTAKEMEDFRSSSANAGNAVFAANIGIVGLSNILQFGRYFGTDLNIASKADRSINKFFGLGTKFNDLGKIERTATSKLRKGLGVTYNVFKRPFTEGVWEEGNQGVVAETAKSWIASKFDPDATGKTVGVIDALKEGFANTYGTPEGRMEIGIGALIGAISGIGGGRGTGFGGITEYQQAEKQLNANIEKYNQLDIPRAAFNLSTRMAYTNQQIAALDAGEQAESKNDAYAARMNYDLGLFTKMYAESEMGMLDDGAKNFEHVINGMSNSELAQEYNISEDEAAKMKEDILSDYNERLSDFKSATKYVDAVLTGSKRELSKGAMASRLFMGMRAFRTMQESAESISRVMGDSSYSSAIMYYSQLNKEGRKLYEEKANLNEEVDALEKEIQELNTSIGENRDVEAYNEKAKKLTEINQRIAQIESELSHYKGDFDAVNFALDRGESMSPEDYASSYESLKSLDGYIRALNASGTESNKRRAALLGVISEDFARAYADFRSVNEIFARMQDPRFMADEESRIYKLFKEEGEKYNGAWDVEKVDGVRINTKIDDTIDKMLSEGKITEEEAFTMKTFNRMEYEFSKKSDVDVISDNEWNTYTTERDLLNNGVTTNSEEYNNLINKVADKVYNDVELSPRERTIYDQNRGAIDFLNQEKGESPLVRLNRIINKLNETKNVNLKTARDANQHAIDSAISTATPEEKDQIRDIIEKRNKLLNDLENGEEIDIDQLADYESEIQDFGNRHGVDGMLDFVEQNRLIDKGQEDLAPTRNVTNMDDLVDHRTPPESSRGGASFDNAQNIEMLTSKSDKNGSNLIISGLKPRALAEMLIDRMGGKMVSTPKEGGAWVISVGGNDIHIYSSGEHSASKIPMSDIEKMQETSIKTSLGPVFTLQPALASANSREVLWLDLDGSLSVIPTNTTYGKNGQDSISDEDVLKTKAGDRVIARVDFEDSYNVGLWNAYKKAKDALEKATSNFNADISNSGLKKIMDDASDTLDKARTRLRDNLVIKLINNEDGMGRFVSVVKGLPSTLSGTAGQQSLLSVREKAAALFMNNAESRKNGYIDVGTYSVARTLPGRPSLNMRMVDGEIVVEDRPVTERASEEIVTVGYAYNGKLTVKDKTEFSSHPFLSLVVRGGKNPGDPYYGSKIPFVVFKHPNGKLYAYPVKVRNVDNIQRNELVDNLNFLLEEDNIQIVDRQEIIGLNTKALAMGINPSNFIRLAGTFDEIRGDVERMLSMISDTPNVIDVSTWISDSRSAKDIALDDVYMNIDLGLTPFHAPKLVMDFDGTAVSDDLLADIDESEINFDSVIEEPKVETDNLESQEVSESLEEGDEEILERMSDRLAPSLSDEDIFSLRSLMLSNGINDIDALNQAFSALYGKKGIKINKASLKASKLYTADEIARILGDKILAKKLHDLVAKFNSVMLEGPSERTRYMLSNEYTGDVSVSSSEYDSSGKKKYINPYVIENNILMTVGGIKDRSEFDKAFGTLPYESIVEKYMSDAEYADDIYQHYSKFTRLSVVDQDGNPVTDSGSTRLREYSQYEKKAADLVISDVNALISVDDEVLSDRELVTEALEDVVENAAKMNIDLVGLKEAYDTKPMSEIQDFLMSLEMYVKSLNSNESLYEDFFADYDAFFGLGNPMEMPVLIDSSLDAFNTNLRVVQNTTFSDVDLFNNNSLLHVQGDVYLKVNRLSKDELYDAIYKLAKEKAAAIPVDIDGMSERDAKNALKEWINKNTGYNQTEEIALNKALFGVSLEENKPNIDIQRELNRYVERKSRRVRTFDDALRLYNQMLREKVRSSDLYNNVLSNIVFKRGYDVDLVSADPISLRDMELLTPESMRDDLRDMALFSNNSLSELFFMSDRPEIDRTIDFYRELYMTHPELAPQINVEYRTGEDGFVRTKFADDLVMMDGVLMEKVAEDGGESVFDVSGNTRPYAVTLESYNKPETNEGPSVSVDNLVKDSEIEDMIDRRSC